VIEAEVHLSLHNFLRSQEGFPAWHHHLAMARLVARALRLRRSALIQVGATCGYQGRYRTSFVASALIWQGAVVIVASEAVQQRLLRVEIPRLQTWLEVKKPIRTGDTWVNGFEGLFLTTPQAWLKGQFASPDGFAPGVPAIIDGVDDLEDWVRESLTTTITAQNWDELLLAYPNQAEVIHTAHQELTRHVFRHPPNPYECYLVFEPEAEILQRLFSALAVGELPQIWETFYRQFQQSHQSLSLTAATSKNNSPSSLIWATIARRQGTFALNIVPLELGKILEPMWERQPTVLIGSALEAETEAPLFCDRFGVRNVTCLKFSSENHTEAIQLYTPHQIPLPNTPEFQGVLIHKIRTLVCLSATAPGHIVILVGDVPLKAQVGTILASEFGSRVQVEKTCLDEKGILVSGWEYWREHQAVLPAPQLLIIATLPLPSMEHPLVAGRVAHYKRSHQDWFRLYLLPAALNELQRAIAPVRESQGIVALLDSRVINRSYGAQILTSLSPLARINYLDPNLFHNTDREI
jgi:ATP-dependent DNA helicase DinG